MKILGVITQAFAYLPAYLDAKKIFMVVLKLSRLREVSNLDKDFNPTMSLEEAIQLYSTVGHRNADFLFHWLYQIYDKTYLPSIDKNYKDELALIKTKLCIFDVLIDDLADNAKLRNKRLLDISLRIPFNGTKEYKNQYLEVSRKIWQDCISSIKKLPRYEEFKDIFDFDLEQVINSMKYSYLINTTDISNSKEDEMYLNHGVMVMLHCDLDLMCSPNFNYEELRTLRPIIHSVQDVAHIGNMINTYPKEIQEADFSSPIISHGIREGLIDKTTVIRDPEQALASLHPLISQYETRMKKNLEKIEMHASEIESIDIYDFTNRLKNVWSQFLNREKYWESQDNTHPLITVKTI